MMGIVLDKGKHHTVSRDDRGRDFLSILTPCQSRIYSYILTSVPCFSDADDILQDTIHLMWEKFDDFEIGTDFLAWGKRIAYFLILRYYRKKKKENKFYYDKQLLLKLGENFQQASNSMKDNLAFLKNCMKKLKVQDQKLLKLRYFENHKAKELAKRYGCSVQYIYRNISRIHQLLLACIQKQKSPLKELF